VIPTAHQHPKTHFIPLVMFFFVVTQTFAALPRPQIPVTTLPDPITSLCSRADSGDPVAIQQLREYLLRHDSSSPNYDIAIGWLRSRAASGSANAEFLLGYLLEHGHGVPRDLPQAVANYQDASARGNSFAQNNLAYLYQRGLGLPRDPRKARELYLASARQNNSAAQTNLASMYYIGDGVSRDPAEAARWFLAAANQGDPIAQHDLGVLYYRGEGVRKDLPAAAKWIGLAATQSLASAETDLAFLYETGSGLSQDEFAAYLWYSRALAAGDSAGASHRDAIARHLNAKQRDEAHALATTSLAPPDTGSFAPGYALSILPVRH